MLAPKAAQVHTERAGSSQGKLPQLSPRLLEEQVARSPVHSKQALQSTQCEHALIPPFASQAWNRPTDLPAEQVQSGPSWNFAGIPISSPSRGERRQERSPLTGVPFPGVLQRKLQIGMADDPLEHEADRVAEQVMRMARPAGKVERKPVAPQISRVASSAATTGMVAPPLVHEVLRSPGQPLDIATRAFFEPSFGHDFSRVRVHSDGRAAESARAIDARAYTMGNHIAFQADECSSARNEGKALLAHELAHVVQQAASSPTSKSGEVLRRKPAGEPDEPLDIALARQDAIERIAEDNRGLNEQLNAAQVDTAEREARVAPFFVQEDQEVKRAEQQIDAGRTQVPEHLATLQKSLKLAARAALTASDNLDELRSKVALAGWLNGLIPTLLRDTAKYEALLKEKKSGEAELAETLAFLEGVKRQIEITREFLPERAAYLADRARYLESRATSAAGRAGVQPDTQAGPGQLDLIRTVIEASPTLKPYLTEQRAEGRQPTDLRDTRKFIIHSTESDLQDEVRTQGLETPKAGKKIGGFYDRRTDTIHLPPDAQFGAALHESVHKYSKPVLLARCGQFLNEGLTQYFADIVLTDQGLPEFKGHAYKDQLACAKRFVNIYRREEVASAYFLGVAGLGTGSLHQLVLTNHCHSFCAPEQRASSD